jgi:hypothetical protein
MRRKRKLLSVVGAIALAVLLYWLENRDAAAPAPAPRAGTAGETALDRAIREKRSRVWVEAEGVVVHLLPDDREGDRHQRFLLDLPSGHTIKISHNIDLAEPVPVRKGDALRFRGRFEWNEKGGAVHWTHRDPSGRQPGGWLELAGTRYR